MTDKAMTAAVAAVADALEKIADRIPSADALRTDHPLQGETFGDLADAIRHAGDAIASGLETVAHAIRLPIIGPDGAPIPEVRLLPTNGGAPQ